MPGIGPEKADCLIARLQAKWPGARVVHRLDRDTSGVIVVARDAATHRALSMQFEARETDKTYIALVAGHPPKESGEIDLPMRKDLANPPLQVIDFVHGRASVTRWKVLERIDAAGADAANTKTRRDAGAPPFAHTRLELTPITGRSHQLRVHLLAIAHPILGDDLYAPPAARAAAPRLCLHAASLAFTHPTTGGRVRFEAPAPF